MHLPVDSTRDLTLKPKKRFYSIATVDSFCIFASEKYCVLFLGYFMTLKILHMNKKILALLFAVPTFGLAQTTYATYKVMGFAPSLDQVAVVSKDVTGHDVALAFTLNGGWYADAKDQMVGVGRNNNPQFRLVKTNKANVYKLYSVTKQKFVAYTDAGQGDRKTKFVDQETDANTDWLIVPNLGGNGQANNFDIFPGTVTTPQNGTPAWNAYGGASENARIGFWQAGDKGSCWSIEVPTQEIKFFNSYDKKNESYFMTIRGSYVHKDGEQFSADDKLQFGQEEYLFQLVGQPNNFQIYNVATGQPIGTDPSKADDKNNYRANHTSSFSAQSYGGRVYVKETRKDNLYLNFRNGFLSTWNSAAAWNGRDEGSRILFATEDGILAEAAKTLEAQINTNYGADKFGEGLGQYPAKAKPGLDVCLQGLEQAQDLTNTDIQTKKELYWTAEGYIEQLTLNKPKKGDLLYIAAVRDNNTVKYFTSTLHTEAENGYGNYGSLAGHLTTKSQKGSDAVFYFKEEEGQPVLVSVATGGQVAWANRGNLIYPTVLQSAEKGAGFNVTSQDGKYVFESGKHFLASDANLTYVMAYDRYSDFAGLRLERVGATLPVHIGDGGTASFWSPVEYSVPEGVTAYSVKVVNNKARLTKIMTNVPKNTAVFLFGPASSDVNLTVVPNGQTPALEENILKGGATATTLQGTAFMLKKNGTGLAKVDGAVPAFKAYFTATEAQVRELLDRGLTSVVSVATEAEDAPVYDLSGRRVQQTTKGGVYVTNGKKFIAK